MSAASRRIARRTTGRPGRGWARGLAAVALCALLPAAGDAQPASGPASGEAGTTRREDSVVERERLDQNALSAGVDVIIEGVRQRDLELLRREQAVAERERAVAELESLIDTRTGELDRIRREIEDRIRGWSSEGPDRVEQLASIYSAMSAQRAGELLGQLELDLAVSVVRAMKKKYSAAALAAMRPDRALQLSRRLLAPLDPRTDAPAKRRN